MKNRTFNYHLKRIFNSTVHEGELASKVFKFWISNELTKQQEEILDKLKNKAHFDYVPSIEPYLIIDSSKGGIHET